MKTGYLVPSLFLAGLIGLGSPVASAHDELAGALIGAGAGVVLGHAIGGHDGAVVGGLLGAAVGVSAYDDHRTVYYRSRPYRSHYYVPAPYYGPRHVYPHWHQQRHDWRHDWHHDRHDWRDGRRDWRDDRDRGGHWRGHR